MTTEELIVQLAATAEPVEPLAPPFQRLRRWALGALCVTIVGVAIIGLRKEPTVIAREAALFATWLLTMTTVLVAAGAALVSSVPGAGPSGSRRWALLAAVCLWPLFLMLSIQSGGSAVARVIAFPFHVGCLAQIVVLSMLPAWTLFTMLRRAAPLEPQWSAGFASLAALALGAAGTQFICPINDPAHLFVGHWLPVAVLAALGLSIGSRVLERRISA